MRAGGLKVLALRKSRQSYVSERENNLQGYSTVNESKASRWYSAKLNVNFQSIGRLAFISILSMFPVPGGGGDDPHIIGG